MSIRPVKSAMIARPTMEGAGVHLHRGFGFGQTSDTDPFLLFDDFRNDTPGDYLATTTVAVSRTDYSLGSTGVVTLAAAPRRSTAT